MAQGAAVAAASAVLLLPWIVLNWRLIGSFVPLEFRRADMNIAMAALGYRQAPNGDFRALAGISSGTNVLRWAVARILDWNQRRPAVRLSTGSRWIPIPLGTAVAALAVVVVAWVAPPLPSATVIPPFPGASLTQPNWTDQGDNSAPSDDPTWNQLPIADTDIIHA